LGYHIVPTQIRNEYGDLEPATSLLEAEVDVPTLERTPEEHLDALGAAITLATGVKLLLAPIPLSPNGFDQSFQVQQPVRFSWGTGRVAARTALIDLLDLASSTYSWDLICTPSALPSDRVCLLTLSFLKVAITDADGKPATTVLRFDRCGNCRP
jgi:hypothetical protein